MAKQTKEGREEMTDGAGSREDGLKIQISRSQVKLSWFISDMVLCVNNPKNATKTSRTSGFLSRTQDI